MHARTYIGSIYIYIYIHVLDMHPLAAASRSRLLETEPKLFVFETSYYMRSVDDIALNMSLRKLSKHEYRALSDIALNYSIRNRKPE